MYSIRESMLVCVGVLVAGLSMDGFFMKPVLEDWGGLPLDTLPDGDGV